MIKAILICVTALAAGLAGAYFIKSQTASSYSAPYSQPANAAQRTASPSASTMQRNFGAQDTINRVGEWVL